MKNTRILVAALLITLVSCFTNTRDKNKSTKIHDLRLDNLEIPKKWIEIPEFDPSRIDIKHHKSFRDLRTVFLTHVDNKEAISFNYGLESQWFEVKKIDMVQDSLVFLSVLPFDSTQTVTISMKYIDKKNFIARWIIDNIVCNYFPYKDTIGDNRVILK
jgi:hypothetical protein